MKWVPIFTDKCINCSGCEAADGAPYCAFNCPTDALTCGDPDDPESPLSKKIAELKAEEFRIYQLDPWEPSRVGVYYAEKGI